LAVTACGGGNASKDAAATSAGAAQPAEEPLPPSEFETQLPEEVRGAVLKPFTGDFDEMVKRRSCGSA
jgi:hypothetical protein